MNATLAPRPATLGIHPRPALQVLRLLDPIAADPTEHPDELDALALAAIDKAITAEEWPESADEALSTRFFLTGDASILNHHAFNNDYFGGFAS